MPTIANAPQHAKIDKGAFNNGRRTLSSTTSCRATLLQSQTYPLGINNPRTDYFFAGKNARKMGKSIEDCLQCHRVCLRNFSHLLTLEPDAERANPEQLSLLLDCAAAIPADLRTARGHRPCRTRVRPNLRAVPQFLQKSPRHLRRTLMPICRDAARSAVADGRP